MRIKGMDRDLSDAEMDARLGRQFRKLLAHHEAGRTDHPYDVSCRDWAQTINKANAGESVAPAADCDDPEVKQGLDSALQSAVPMSQAFKGLDRFSGNSSPSIGEPLSALRK